MAEVMNPDYRTAEEILKETEDRENRILKQGFKAGVTMACLSMGKFTKTEENEKLEKFAEALYSEFADLFNKDEEENEVHDTETDTEQTEGGSEQQGSV